MRLKTRNKGQFFSPELVFFVQICFQLHPSLSPRPTQTPTHRLSTSHLHPLLFFCLSFARSRSVNTHTSLNPSARAKSTFFACQSDRILSWQLYTVATTTTTTTTKKRGHFFLFCLVQELNHKLQVTVSLRYYVHLVTVTIWGGKETEKKNFLRNTELIIRREVFQQKAKNAV